VVELSLTLAGLLVTVRGPPERASEALSLITGSLAGLGPSTAESENSFEVVSSADDSSASGRPRVLESRDQVASTFASCPAAWISRAPRLGVLSLLVSSGFVELGRLVSGRVQCWIKEPPHLIGLNRWTCAAGFTRCFVVRVWIVLWCFALLAATGQLWVPSAPVGVPVLSATHLPVSVKPLSTSWCF